MNRFLQSTVNQISTHGTTCVYLSKGNQVYNPATSKSTSTEVSHSVKMYPKHIKASQFSYPNLIGKEVIMFYLANNGLGFTPKVGDYITFNSNRYQVDSFQSHTAIGEVCLYRIIAAKG